MRFFAAAQNDLIVMPNPSHIVSFLSLVSFFGKAEESYGSGRRLNTLTTFSVNSVKHLVFAQSIS